MVCSYEHCLNPTHTSGGSWKYVTTETKAGGQDWSPFVGRLFCNACFTQVASPTSLPSQMFLFKKQPRRAVPREKERG